MSKQNFLIHKQKWPSTTLKVPSGWEGLENYMISLIQHFNIEQNSFLEFGVDLGYSLHVFSKLFAKVTGVDAFVGDVNIHHKQGEEFYNNIKNTFSKYKNVNLIRSFASDFIKNDNNFYDLIHVDIVHEYEPTYECADWAVQHSKIVLIHDTEIFPAMKTVCVDIAKKHNLGFYNILEHAGLGILYQK